MAKRLTPDMLKELTQILQKFQQIQASLTKQDVNIQNEDKQSALMIACLWSKPGLARRALLLGADIHQTDSHGREPIHLAAIGGDVNIIAMLLDAGADINKRKVADDITPRLVMNYHRNEAYGITPLGLAVIHRRLEAVRFLLAKGANPFLELGDGESNLHLAARDSTVEIAKLLIKAGLEDKRDRSGDTPYHWARRYAGSAMRRLLDDTFRQHLRP